MLTVLVLLAREANDGCDKRWCLSDCLQEILRLWTRGLLFDVLYLNWIPQLPLAFKLKHVVKNGLDHQWDVADGFRLKTVALGGGGEIYRKGLHQGFVFHVCKISQRRGSGIFFVHFILVPQHFAGEFVDFWEKLVLAFHLIKRFRAEEDITAINQGVRTVIEGLFKVTLSTVHI